MNFVISQSIFRHGRLKSGRSISSQCKKEYGVYLIVGDTAFDTDGGSAYRLAKYLCMNGWFPILRTASYAISNRLGMKELINILGISMIFYRE